MSSGTSNTKLDRRRGAAILALLTEPTIEAAALKARVGLSTLKLWLSDKEFREEFLVERRKTMDRAVTSLARNMEKASDTLAKNLEAAKTADQNVAAKLILDHGFKSLELLDLAGRVEALERLEKERQSQGGRR
jgi:hypothetical protein